MDLLSFVFHANDARRDGVASAIRTGMSLCFKSPAVGLHSIDGLAHRKVASCLTGSRGATRVVSLNEIDTSNAPRVNTRDVDIIGDGTTSDDWLEGSAIAAGFAALERQAVVSVDLDGIFVEGSARPLFGVAIELLGGSVNGDVE